MKYKIIAWAIWVFLASIVALIPGFSLLSFTMGTISGAAFIVCGIFATDKTGTPTEENKNELDNCKKDCIHLSPAELAGIMQSIENTTVDKCKVETKEILQHIHDYIVNEPNYTCHDILNDVFRTAKEHNIIINTDLHYEV